MEDVEAMVHPLLCGVQSDAAVLVCVATFLVVGFKKGGFDFPKGVALMTHRVKPLTGQSVGCSLLMLDVWITSDHLEPWPSRY